MSASVDPLGNHTTYSYDLAGQQTSRQDARGNRITNSYDLAGQVAGSVDRRRHRTRSAHGSARLVVRRAGCAILFRISQWNVRAAKRGSETVCQNASDVAIL